MSSDAYSANRTILTSLWIVALLNYAYADIFTLFFSTEAQSFANMPPMGMLGLAVLMEVAILMVILNWVLPTSYNRWANVIAAMVHTLAALSSLFVGAAVQPYYFFFVAVESVVTLVIIAYAWRRPRGRTLDAG